MSVFTFIKRKILDLDLMTNSPQLRVEGKRSYQTTIGGIINLLLIIATFVGIIYFGQELWNKSEPMVVVSSMESQDVGPFKFGLDGFMVFIGLEFPNLTYFTDPRIATINATLEVNEFLENGGQKYTITPIEYDVCSKYHKQEEIPDQNSVDVNYFFCIKPSNITISGYWGAPRTDLMRFVINMCVNSTNNNNHYYPEEEIKSYVQGGLLSMFTTNSFLNLNNPDTPVELKLQNWFTSLNLDFTLSYYYKFSEMRFLDDHGFLLQSIKETKFPYFTNPNILYYGSRGSLLGEVWVLGEKYGQKITRAYVKIQDVLMRIGGLLKAFTVMATIVANLSSEFDFFSDSSFNFRYQLGKTISNSNSKEVDDNQSDIYSVDYNLGLNKSLNTKSEIKMSQLNYNNFVKTSKTDEVQQSTNTVDASNNHNLNHNNLIQNQSNNLKNAYNKSPSNLKVNIDNHYNKNKNNRNITKEKDKEKDSESFDRSMKLFNIKNETNLIKEIDFNKEIIDDKLNNDNNLKLKDKNKNNTLNKFDNNKKLSSLSRTADFIKKHNNRLLKTTLPYYSKSSNIKDFIGQLFGYLLCTCNFNKRLMNDKKSYQMRIDKMLSINYIFKKFFLLEILAKRNFSNEELEHLHEPYLNQMLFLSNKQDIVYDDSNVFDLQKIS